MLSHLCIVSFLFAAAAGLKTLVILDNEEQKGTFSAFYQFLQDRGHELSFHLASDKTLKLSKYGEYIFDNIILSSPETVSFPRGADRASGGYLEMDRDRAALEKRKRTEKANKGLSLYDLTDFVDGGRNLLIFTGDKVGPDIRKLCLEFSMDLDEEESFLYDEKAFDTGLDTGDNRVVRVESKYVTAPVVGGDVGSGGLSVRGIGHVINLKNDLVFSVLETKNTTLRGKVGASKKELSVLNDAKASVVSALQARNDARVALLTVMDMCSDRFVKANENNHRFCESVATWTFQERAVLRISPFRHHKRGENKSPYMYRERDFIHFEVDIQEKLLDGSWAPYRAGDVQLELVMLDPYIRTFLTPVPSSPQGTYRADFQSPDVYGIFKMKLWYKRKGYNVLHQEEVTPLRNFKHNDYERFIWCATPYYASCAVTIVTLVLFSITFMFHKERSLPLEEAKKKN